MPCKDKKNFPPTNARYKMANTWFRLYHEFATDPKVQSLSEAMQRRLVMLFCLESSGQLGKLSDDEIAFYLRVTSETLHETFHLFREKGFLDEKHRIAKWESRQYHSDNSTERVKKYRDKTKTKTNETAMKRFSNANVTAPDTDTDTDKKEEAGKPTSSSTNRIIFDFRFEQWQGITDADMAKWQDAYPACDVGRQLKAMAMWLAANPAKRKSNYLRFITTWLTKAQDRGGDMKSNQPKGKANGESITGGGKWLDALLPRGENQQGQARGAVGAGLHNAGYLPPQPGPAAGDGGRLLAISGEAKHE